MSHELTTTRPPGAMADLHAPQHIETLRIMLHNRLDRQGMTDIMEVLPTQQERGRLRDRDLSIRSLLRPAHESVGAQSGIGAALGEMLGGYLAVKGTKAADAAEIIAGYVQSLQELPAWAVIQVCTEFKEGRAIEVVDGKEKRLSPDFAPTAPRIFMLARAKLDALNAEAESIRRILSAKIGVPTIGETERNRVGALMKHTADVFAGRAKAEREAESAKIAKEAQEARDRAASILRAANGQRIARYYELGLVPVFSPDGKIVVDPDLLDEKDRHPQVTHGR